MKIDYIINQQIEKEINPKPSPWYYILNDELVKEPKPCFTGDRVHLHSMNGCFTVHSCYVKCFTVKKNGELIDRPWSDFKCKAGSPGSNPVTNRIRVLENLSRKFMIKANLLRKLRKG